MTANKREIRRYLAAGDTPEESIEAQIDRAVALAEQTVRPNWIYSIYDCVPLADGVQVGDVFFAGTSLAKNLAGCTRVILLAVTLGAEADLLLRKESIRGAFPAAVMQAVLTERIERACDAAEEEAAVALAGGGRTRPRFSLGYGDTLLSDQKRFFALLPVGKRLGITLSDGYLMTPTKSVTALIGVLGQAQEG